MYIGHFALGIAAKRIAPELPTVALAAAPVALDLGSGVLGVLGLDPTWQWTHSLVAALAWAVAVGITSGVWRGWRAGVLLGSLAATHLPLDYVTSWLPLWTDGPSIGLSLMRWPTIDYVVEVAMLLASWLLYLTTLPRTPRRWLTASLVPMFAAFQLVFSFMMS